MKVDVAVQSYKKPESLLYTLMSLKKVSGDLIDTVYINDDCSNDGSVEIFNDIRVKEYFAPWKLNVRVNTKNVGVNQVYMLKHRPDYMNWLFVLSKFKRFIDPKTTHNKDDVRYQYAIDNTDKKYLLVIHDDVKFFKNIVQLYLDTMEANPNLAIVGDLGQCWRCKFSEICSPKKLMQGFRPPHFPLTPKDRTQPFNPKKGYGRDCRINEWSCLIDVEKSRLITQKHGCLFGNYYRYSDIGAYWFCKVVEHGFDFSDPIASEALKTQLDISPEHEEYYLHAWQGHPGHSVWVDQGMGIVKYNRDEIVDLMKKDFGFDFPHKLIG